MFSGSILDVSNRLVEEKILKRDNNAAMRKLQVDVLDGSYWVQDLKTLKCVQRRVGLSPRSYNSIKNCVWRLGRTVVWSLIGGGEKDILETSKKGEKSKDDKPGNRPNLDFDD